MLFVKIARPVHSENFQAPVQIARMLARFASQITVVFLVTIGRLKEGPGLGSRAVLHLRETTVESSAFRLRQYEKEISTGGPKAIGNHGESAAEKFLRAHGIFPIAQYPYRDETGFPHSVDFYDIRRRTAHEVKTGRFGVSSRQDFRVEHCAMQ